MFDGVPLIRGHKMLAFMGIVLIVLLVTSHYGLAEDPEFPARFFGKNPLFQTNGSRT